MIPLKKSVRRKTEIILDNRLSARPCDEYTVTLAPPDETIPNSEPTIGFRRLRSRTQYTLPLSKVYILAFKAARGGYTHPDPFELVGEVAPKRRKAQTSKGTRHAR